ncbi:hypothetical protein HDU82_009152 [Entophlyctis luteolus]|nr:hypothetical protein HDU82_009152 [Entophlyctis luteolus]
MKVLPNGRISPNCLGLYSQGHADALKPLTEFIKSQGCVPGIQLAHAGLKASTLSPFKKTGNAVLASLEVGGWIDNVVGPTAGKLSPELADARALSITEIKEIVEAFANAAKYALDAGFSVVEVHGAHGYLIHSFLSPFSNKRTDEYGGSFENRARLAVEVCQAVRKVWPDNLPLFFRTSATDWAEDGQIGFTPEDAVRLAVLLKNTAGVDVVNCSSGGLFTPKDPSVLFQEGYNVSFSKRIRKESGISTAVAGMITRANHANGIISEGSADLVLLAREFLRNPNWVFDAAKELGAEIEWPVQYRRGKPRD